MATWPVANGPNELAAPLAPARKRWTLLASKVFSTLTSHWTPFSARGDVAVTWPVGLAQSPPNK